MDNLISRQDAIDAFNTNVDELVVAGKENADSVEKYLNGVIDKIKRLPSVQPEETIEEQERGIDEALRVARDIATIIENEKDMRVILNAPSVQTEKTQLSEEDATFDCISRKAAINALWKALYAYEDKTEKQFQESDELDVYDWILHREFFQNMNDIDRQTILALPSVQPEQDDNSEFWRKRAEQYRDMCFDLVNKINQGIKVDSIAISEAGIVFKASPSVQANCVYRHEDDEECIIKCDDNNAKYLWLLSLILLMKGDDGFRSEAERREEMSDYIDRQEAIDALSTPRGILYPIRTVEELPSAQPQRWIPVTPDSPPLYMPVLTWDGGTRHVEQRIPYVRDEIGEKIFSDWWIDGDEKWDEWAEYQPNLRDGCAIKWMPLPPSYKGGEDEQKD